MTNPETPVATLPSWCARCDTAVRAPLGVSPLCSACSIAVVLDVRAARRFYKLRNLSRRAA